MILVVGPEVLNTYKQPNNGGESKTLPKWCSKMWVEDEAEVNDQAVPESEF